jgi:allantoin racemase
MRIWHQSMAALDDLPAYLESLEGHLKAVAGSETSVALHGALDGSYLGLPPAQILKFPYARHLVQSQAIEHCLRAASEGYDAVAFATFGDHFLTECRSLVDIPVTSMPESSILVGCSCAEKTALVTLGPNNVLRVATLVDRLGLSSRVSAILPLDPPVTEAELVEILASADPGPFLDRFSLIADRAIKSGADLIIPAEGVLNELLFRAGCDSFGDVAIMDALGVLIGYTELMVNLRSRTGLSAGRRWTYPKPDSDLLSRLRQQNGLSPLGGAN